MAFLKHFRFASCSYYKISVSQILSHFLLCCALICTFPSPRDNLEIGQPIRMQSEGGKWRRGICNAKVAPRSYVMEVDGDLYRRNRRHIRPDSTSIVQAPEHTEGSKGTQQKLPESSPSLEEHCLPPAQEESESASLETCKTPVKAGATPGEHPLQPEAQMAVVPRMTTRSGRVIKPPNRLISSM